MKFIKVIAGGVSVKRTDANGNARYELKTAQDKPFECTDEQAERFVGLGVAEYVGQFVSEEKPEKITGHLDASDLETWDFNEIKKLAADLGVKPAGKKKADYIAAIVAEEVEFDTLADDFEDDDELPDLGVIDPE